MAPLGPSRSPQPSPSTGPTPALPTNGSPSHTPSSPHTTPHPSVPDGDTHDLAVTLCPILRQQLDGRLSAVEWFHATWQRGGAATGFAQFTTPQGATVPVLVKLPVGPSELNWSVGLGAVDLERWDDEPARRLPVPRVLAAGDTLNGYDLGWIIVERLAGPSLSKRMTEADVHELLSAAVDFQALAAAVKPLEARPATPPWRKAIEHSRTVAKYNDIPDAQRWNDQLKRVSKHADDLIAKWERRPINAWCHGDLHPGNVLRRPPAATNGSTPSPAPGRCVLIDLALAHCGHWLEDALYLERQYWGHEDMLGNTKPVQILAKLRKERGLPVDDQYMELSNIRRVLKASCALANMEREGNSKYLQMCLEVIERTLPQIAH